LGELSYTKKQFVKESQWTYNKGLIKKKGFQFETGWAHHTKLQHNGCIRY
jgi:hypothetical protein